MAGGVKVEAHGLWPIAARVRTPEEPGEFSFPPLAATVTGAARLLLALLQADIEALGGTFVACDTDSLIGVASSAGGLLACAGGSHRLPDGSDAVRALTYDELDDVLLQIEALNPYRPATVSHLVKLEDENFALDGSGRPVELRALAISPKRYVLYELDSRGPVIRKASEHGLGMYRPPIPNPPGWDKPWRCWVDYVWQRIIRDVEALPALPEPDWYDRPALSQLSITTPRLLAPFGMLNVERPYQDQIKPFGFMLTGHPDPLAALPAGLSLDRLMPVAPYTSKPEEFLGLPWLNRADGARIRVTTRLGGEPGKVRLKTYRDVISDYGAHPDTKGGDPAGGQAHRGSRGVLQRLHIEITQVAHIGKESNHLDEEGEGGLLARDEVYVEYRDVRQEWMALLPGLLEFRDRHGLAPLREASGLSERALRYALHGQRMPRQRARDRLASLLS